MFVPRAYYCMIPHGHTMVHYDDIYYGWFAVGILWFTMVFYSCPMAYLKCQGDALHCYAQVVSQVRLGLHRRLRQERQSATGVGGRRGHLPAKLEPGAEPRMGEEHHGWIAIGG